MNIAIFTGELSGDLIGGALARELRRQCPDVTLWGLGSASMKEAGVELLADSAAWGAIGIVEALGKAPGLLFDTLPKVKSALRKRRPDVVVPIDFGAFNVPVARYAHNLGQKVCYYFPPGAWRRTGTKGANLAQITDLLATPFVWSEDRYRNLGCNVVCVGHPMLERVHPVLTKTAFCEQFGLEPSRPIIGLLPGSRRQEITHLMPTLLQTARVLYRQVPDAQFVVAVAPSVSPEMMAEYLHEHRELRDRISDIWLELTQDAETKFRNSVTRTAEALTPGRQPQLVTASGLIVSPEMLREREEARKRSDKIRARGEQALPPTVLAKGLTYDVMAHSDLLLTCSGTATLEAALFGTPMVILYRGSKVMEVEYRLRGIKKKLLFMGLPNILADRSIVPELVQHDANPEGITSVALPLLNDVRVRQQARSELLALKEALGTPGASERTAKLILELAKR